MRTDREFSYAASMSEFPGTSIVTRRNSSEDPDEATAETVALMQAAAIEDSNSPQVWAATHGAMALRRRPDQRGTCEAIYQWIASHIHFRSDEPVLNRLLGLDDELDLLIRPARLLTMSRPAEDCDGFTMLACSMMLAAGVPCEIVTIKADHDDPSRFSHVYCQAFPDQFTVLVMDCSQAAQHGYPCGWEAPEYFDRKTWGVMEPERPARKGLHGLGQSGETDTESMGWLTGGSDGGDTSYGPGSIFDALKAGGGGTPGGYMPGGGSSFNLNALLANLAGTGGRLVQQANLPPGYALLPNGTVAPASSLSSMFGAASVSPTLLIGGGVLLLALVLGRK